MSEDIVPSQPEEKTEAATPVPERPEEKTTDVVETNEEAVKQEKEEKSLTIRPEEVRTGMTIRVHERIEDVSPKGEKRQRIQIFQGMVIGVHGSGLSKTMTIFREQKGYGVEKIYPLFSPVVTAIECVKRAQVRRAKLNFLTNPRRRFKRKFKERKEKI